jgi:DNA-binding HxlR family transcriptional regulator
MAETGRRLYGQYCGLAAALDVLGERWTLLIVRELLLAPRRYGELLDALPGIGTNLLAERLKFLVEQGVVRRVPATDSDLRRQAYELTGAGESLRRPVLDLARWGMHRLASPTPATTVRADWGYLAVQAMVDAARLPGVRESYLFRVDDLTFFVSVDDGTARIGRGEPPDPPAMVATTDATTFIEIGAGRLSPFEATVCGRLEMSGPPDAVLRCSALLGLIEPAVQ